LYYKNVKRKFKKHDGKLQVKEPSAFTVAAVQMLSIGVA